MKCDFESLGHGLVSAFQTFSREPAIVVDGVTMTYSELGKRSYGVALELGEANDGAPQAIGIMAARSASAYVGITAAALAGCTYVPLNPRFPGTRLMAMLQASDCRTVIAGEECAESLGEICRNFELLTVVCPFAGPKLRDLAASFPKHSFIFSSDARPSSPKLLHLAGPNDFAYLMFTSGTTGTPKGVPISHQNVCSYMRYTVERYKAGPGDRFTQLFDLTFDLSVHDIFVSLLSGATLYVVPSESVMAPTRFVRDNELTMWFSVPSVPMFMSRMRMLKPGIFPALRYALFCGEALPQRTAEMFQAAARNAILENLYGPTEATIAITNYRWDPARSPEECVNGLVPIGKAFDGNRTRVVGAGGKCAPPGESGELYLSGLQVATGYLNDPVRTAERFVRFEDDPAATWYRTGDLAREADGELVYLGRADDQIQVRGFRVELQEIDNAIRRFAQTDLAIAVPAELRDGCAQSVYAVVQGTTDTSLVHVILSGVRSVLPDYMVPSDVKFVSSMPLNVNGKIDRKALAESLNANG